jgi:hypothetical protein
MTFWSTGKASGFSENANSARGVSRIFPFFKELRPFG